MTETSVHIHRTDAGVVIYHIFAELTPNSSVDIGLTPEEFVSLFQDMTKAAAGSGYCPGCMARGTCGCPECMGDAS